MQSVLGLVKNRLMGATMDVLILAATDLVAKGLLGTLFAVWHNPTSVHY
jgi:hypothetical protein